MTVEYQIRDFIDASNAGGMTSVNARAAINDLQSLLVSKEEQQWLREGRVFFGRDVFVLADDPSSPAVFAPATLVRQQPGFMVRTAAGVVIIPLMSMFALEATSAIVEVLVSSCDNDPGVANMTEFEPINANSRFAGVLSSACTAYTTNAGNTGTAPTNVVDLYREYHQADRDAITGAPTPPIIYKPSAGYGQEAIIGNDDEVHAFLFYGLAGVASLSTGFSIHAWAEFTYDEFYG